MSSQEQQILWKGFLEKYTAKDLLGPDFRLIRAEKKDLVLDTLKVMLNANISAVPVYDKEKDTYIGTLSIFDLVAVVVFLSDSKLLLDALARQEVNWYEYITQEQRVIAEQQIGELINASERSPWCPVYQGKPLVSVMDMFSKLTNFHHLPIINGDGQVIGMVSQLRVIEFLSKLTEKDPLADKKLKEFLKPKQVLSVNRNQTALEAFRIMAEQKVSGLAVVDDDGDLIGSISSSDLKRSEPSNVFSDLTLPITEYLNRSRQGFRGQTRSQNPITCTMDDTIRDAMSKLASNHVHRLFLVDGKKPIGVVSLCDIISIEDLLPEAKQ